MAIFSEEDPSRLDWKLLQNGPIALYYQLSVLADDLAWLRDEGYDITDIDCSSWHTEGDLHRGFADHLAFPDYYGRNLDGLNDCLSDLYVPEPHGRVLVLYRFDVVATPMPPLAWHVLDIIAANARRFLLLGQRLLTLIQSDDPQIAFDPVGACPVMWNPREWLNSSRSSSETPTGLVQSWQRTESYLELARHLLVVPIEEADDARIRTYEEYLRQNELELALDELEALGELNNASRQFWVLLRKAANNILLKQHVQRYDLKLNRT